MAFLYSQFDVEGRPRHVLHQANARDFASDQVGIVHFLLLPEDQDLEAEIGFFTSWLPSHIAAVGGEWLDGSQWMMTLERGPVQGSANVQGDRSNQVSDSFITLQTLFRRALELNPRLEVSGELRLTSAELHQVFADADAVGSGVVDLSFTNQLRALVAEACGYPLREVVEHWLDGCAFPSASHECQGDFFTDVFQASAEGRIKSGDEHSKELNSDDLGEI